MVTVLKYEKQWVAWEKKALFKNSMGLNGNLPISFFQKRLFQTSRQGAIPFKMIFVRCLNVHLLHNFKRDLAIVDCLLHYLAGAEPDQRNLSFLPYGQSRKGSSYLHISCVFRGLLKKGALFSIIRCLSTVWGRRYCPLIPWYWRPSTSRRKKVLYYKTATQSTDTHPTMI